MPPSNGYTPDMTRLPDLQFRLKSLEQDVSAVSQAFLEGRTDLNLVLSTVAARNTLRDACFAIRTAGGRKP
jgi:hypothetical protein